MERKIIYARDGYILTDGYIYGKEIILEEGKLADGFYEITEEEYSQILKSEETPYDI
jgi:hypothetical protein